METYPERNINHTHREREIALSKWLFQRAPALATELIDQTGVRWRIVGEPMSAEGYGNLGFHLVRDDGLKINVHLADGKATCGASPPTIPDGTAMGRYPRLLEFVERGETYPDCRAQVSARRLDTHLHAVAADFIRRVIEPYAALYPKILDKQRKAAAQFATRDLVAARFAKRYGVEIRGEGGSERTVYLNSIGGISISPDCRFKFTSYSPSVSEAAMTALVDVVMAEAKAEWAEEEAKRLAQQ